MRLQVLVPHDVLLDRTGVIRVVAESIHGVFVLLPHHVDFVVPILPGLLLYETGEGESVAGVDAGVLLKVGDHVRVSVHDAVQAPELDAVRSEVQRRFRTLDERETRARTAMARLEASFYRRFIEQEGFGVD